jgi:hypothetical protein
MGYVLEYRIAERAAKVIIRERYHSCIAQNYRTITLSAGSFSYGSTPRVYSYIDGFIKDQGGKMPITTTDIEVWSGEVDLLVVLSLYRSHHCTEVRQVAQVQPQEVLCV